MREVTSKIGPYTLGEKLGEGGMAEVYLATSPEGKKVVLKLLHGQIDDQEHRDLFVREARLATSLDHPNIVRVFELIEHEGELALAMEYLKGLSLHQVARRAWMAGRSLPIEPLVQAMADAARALHYAHHRDDPIVHRDVSPDNLLLTTSGVTKLLDFGVAKSRGGQDLTQAGQLKGKLNYMSPEQMRGQPLDGRADLWALGITFYFLFTGRKPFKRDDEVQTMRAVLSDRLPPATEFNPRIPRDLEHVLNGTLERELERRISTGAELAMQLSALLRSVPAGYVPPARLLQTLDEVDPAKKSKPPKLAALPSVDWEAGKQLPDSVYDQTRVVDGSEAERPGGETMLWAVQGLETLATDADDDDDVFATGDEPTFESGPTTDPTALLTEEEPDQTRTFMPQTFSREERSDTHTMTATDSPLPAPQAAGSPVLGIVAAVLLLGLAITAAVALIPDREPPPLPPPPIVVKPPAIVVEPPPLPVVDAGPPKQLASEQPQPKPKPEVNPKANPKENPKANPKAEREIEVKGPPNLYWWTTRGEKLGKAPERVSVPASARYLIAVDRETSGRTRVAIRDEVVDFEALKTGTLTIRARPWANITLGRRDLGLTPIEPLELPPGKYRVTLKWNEIVVERPVEVKSGQPTALQVNMRAGTTP